MSEVKQPKLNDDVNALVEKMNSAFSIDSDNGVGSAPDNFYADNLPETVNMDHVKALSDYNSNFIAAGVASFGNMAVDAMTKNAELKDASLTIPMGVKDSVTYNVNREHTYPNRFAKDGDATITKYGSVSTCYEVHAGNLGGQLKHARDIVRNAALEKLAK